MNIKGFSVDFDNVLYDLESVNQDFIKEHYGIELTALDVTDWDFYKNNYPEVMNVWKNWEMYSKGEIFKESINFINTLKNLGEVQIVTSTPPIEEVIKNKDIWIKNIFGDIDIIHSHEKHIHTKDTILIDDSPANIASHIENNNNPGLLFDFNRSYGWTKDFQDRDLRHCHRTESHEHAVRIIKKYYKG